MFKKFNWPKIAGQIEELYLNLYRRFLNCSTLSRVAAVIGTNLVNHLFRRQSTEGIRVNGNCCTSKQVYLEVALRVLAFGDLTGMERE